MASMWKACLLISVSMIEAYVTSHHTWLPRELKDMQHRDIMWTYSSACDLVRQAGACIITP